ANPSPVLLGRWSLPGGVDPVQVYSSCPSDCPFCLSTGYRPSLNTEPRSALAALITALKRHYEAAASSRDDDDPALDAATDQLTTAFDAYDDALFDAFDIATPLIVFDEDDDDDDEDFDDL